MTGIELKHETFIINKLLMELIKTEQRLFSVLCVHFIVRVRFWFSTAFCKELFKLCAIPTDPRQISSPDSKAYNSKLECTSILN